MQEGFFKEHKKLCISAGVLILILTGIYLYFLFKPGLWFQETFLYRQSEGVYSGSDSYGDYELFIHRKENKADIEFTADETVKQYEISWKAPQSDIQILENGEPVFEGRAILQGEDYYLLMEKDGNLLDDAELVLITGTDADKNDFYKNDLFPEKGQLYNWSITEKEDIRGNLSGLFCILFCAVFLILDIKFPNFFFFLRHGLAVNGGEPSDWYRAGQAVASILLVIGIFTGIILSFTTP